MITQLSYNIRVFLIKIFYLHFVYLFIILFETFRGVFKNYWCCYVYLHCHIARRKQTLFLYIVWYQDKHVNHCYTHRANLHRRDAYSNYSEKSILKICKYVWGSFDLPGSENFYCDSVEICYHTNNLDQQYYTIILRTMFPVYRLLSLHIYCFLSGGMYV